MRVNKREGVKIIEKEERQRERRGEREKIFYACKIIKSKIGS